MKKITLFFIFLLVAVSYTTAQKSVALHSNGTTTIFGGDSPLTEAYDASITGDTLYVSGGNFTMPNNIDKGLVIIGAGYDTESTAATQKTYITNTTRFTIGSDASNFYMEGMEFQTGINITAGVITNFTLMRCKLNGQLVCAGSGVPTNATIVQCEFIGDVNFGGVTNSVISNCIIRDQIYNSDTNVLKNNILTVSDGFGTLRNCDTNTFMNNIFTSTGLLGDGNCSFNNYQYNIFAGATPAFHTGYTDLYNHKGVDMATVLVDLAGSDFHLLPGASTSYLGDDGTEVGLYGGILPFKEGAIPINPHISQKSIQTTTDSNGLLNISFTVDAQQN